MPTRSLEMKYAGGGIVHHLGFQMYRGPTTALAELIANAWDSDSPKVYVKIPLSRPLKKRDKIVVTDYGTGMTFENCNEKILVIGRNRRTAEGKEFSPKGRKLMAHKGLGKLACFGIANTMEVKTVHNRRLTHFIMKFEEIDKLNQGETYHPKVLADNKKTKLRNGTTVVLSDISKDVTVSEDQFLKSMAARFTVLSDKFRVYVNKELLTRELGVKIELRFPEKIGDDVEAIENDLGITKLSSGVIKWWIGFAKDTIKTKEFQGVSVITNGKMSQEPWAFGLAGGTTGQHGLQYMIGEITADFIDSGLSMESDHIGTNRCEVVWDDPEAKPLYDWARAKIKRLLKVWAEKAR